MERPMWSVAIVYMGAGMGASTLIHTAKKMAPQGQLRIRKTNPLTSRSLMCRSETEEIKFDA